MAFQTKSLHFYVNQLSVHTNYEILSLNHKQHTTMPLVI